MRSRWARVRDLVKDMVITIDGPAGTGKSSVSLEVARRLGFGFLDTGAMYRAIGLAAARAGVSLDDVEGLGALAEAVRVDFDWTAPTPLVRLNGEVVAELIRTEAASNAASRVAVAPKVREVMVRLQREVAGERGDLVTEGRDQGTVVFPEAELKVYLDGTAEARAGRRMRQLAQKGVSVDYRELLGQIMERDARDSGRATSPLAAAGDARTIDTTSLTQEEVTSLVVGWAKDAMGQTTRD